MKLFDKKKTIRMLIAIMLFISLISSPMRIVHAKAKNLKDVAGLLTGYDLWMHRNADTGEVDDFVNLTCPKKNCTTSEMLSYTYDIFKRLKGEYITDLTEIYVSFNFDEKRFSSVAAIEDYAKLLFDLRTSLFSDQGSLYTSDQACDYPEPDEGVLYDPIIDFGLHVNGPTGQIEEATESEKRQYVRKLKEIVKTEKTKSKNEKELAENLGNWVNENTDHLGNLSGYAGASAFEALMTHSAICEGFSHLYRELCEVAGLPTLLVVSEKMNHMWNWVFADGHWYCIDTTLDGELYNSDFECLGYSSDHFEYSPLLRSLILDPDPLLTTCEQTLTITGTINLKNYLHNLKSGSKVKYSSSAPSIVSVDSSGKVTPHKYGSAVVSIQVVQSGKTWKFKQPVCFEKPEAEDADDPEDYEIDENDSGRESQVDKSKKPQNMIITAKNKTVKKKSVKKKKKKIKGTIKVKGAVGKVTYKKIAKGSSKKLSINSKTGVITVKKGTKKGKYKIKVKITAAGNSQYQNASKTAIVVIKVK